MGLKEQLRLAQSITGLAFGKGGALNDPEVNRRDSHSGDYDLR